MNKLPYSSGHMTRSMTAFGGLCASHRAGDGDIVDMCDMSSDKYPLLVPRKARKYIDMGEYKVYDCAKLHGKPAFITDKGLLYNGALYNEACGHDGARLHVLGDYICLFPDGVYWEFAELYYALGDSGYMVTVPPVDYAKDALAVTDTDTNNFPATAYEGAIAIGFGGKIYKYTEGKWEYTEKTVEESDVYRTAKTVFHNSNLNLTFKSEQNIKYEMSNKSGSVSDDVTKQYLKITYNSALSSSLNVGDFIYIYGASPTNNFADDTTFDNLTKGVEVVYVGNDFIVVTFPGGGFATGNYDTLVERDGIVIKRSAPILDCSCVYHNRIYGASGNTIYISALGEPAQFTSYSLASTSAWAAETAGDDFIACIPYDNGVIFFKEREIYRVYGETASEFGYSHIVCPGVRADSSRSLAASSGYLYYLSHAGVMRYGGGYPVLMSDGIDLVPSASVGGADDVKYYLYTTEGVYVHDTRYGIWHKESIEGNCKGFFNVGTTLYAISGEGDRIYVISGEAEDDSFPGFKVQEGEAPSSSVTLADITEGTLFKKEYKRMRIRLAVLSGEVNIYITYDGGAEADKITVSASESGKRVIYKDVMLKRCDYMSIKISGTGDYVIYGIDRDVCISSDEELMYKY